MMGVAAYESYKDSGEGWIEDVPAHWEIRKLKHLFQEKKHRQNLDLNCGSISFGEVVEKDDERVPLATKASYQEVSKGEFLVNPLNLNYDLKSLRIGLSDIDVVVSAGYLVLQAKDEMDKRYFKYLLHRYDVAYMKLLGSGVRQTISFNHIANSILVAPPLPEQRAIAAFLDDKCAKIDGAVKIKEDQIALLRERRQIIIQEAVTRGLNPAAPMKDSGIDWIGQIPAHWDIPKLKHVSNFVFDGTHGSYPRVDDGYRLLSVRNIVDGSFVFRDDDSRISELHYREISSKFKIKPGDIQLAIVGATLGKVAIVGQLEEPFVTQRSVATIRLKRGIENSYVAHFISSPSYQKFLWLNAIFSAQPGIYLGTIQNSYIPRPPLQEQREIVASLAITTSKLETAITIKQEQIAALKEYKTSLINAAVTGKIKVI